MKTYVVWMFGASLVLSASFTIAILPVAVPGGTSQDAPFSRSANPTPSNARIRIVSPREDAILPLGQTKVEVSTENIVLDAAHPWSLYLDGNLVGTIASGESTFTLSISVSGPHEIKATVSDSGNSELASASVEVTAAPATPTTSPFNLPWVAPIMAVLLIGVAAILLFSLRVTRRGSKV
jgi:hypothetical protein